MVYLALLLLISEDPCHTECLMVHCSFCLHDGCLWSPASC
jgi:hypothetical protein